MLLSKFIQGPLQVNCYCIAAEEMGDCVVIDPGNAEPIWQFIRLEKLHCTHILLTHGHFDHMMGVAELREKTGAKVLVHEKDEFLLERNDKEAAPLGIRVTPCKADGFVHGGEELLLAGLSIKVLETPGHTPGGVCYYLEKERILFSGDTLFYMSVGRTDLPSSNEWDLRQSILHTVLPLPGDIEVYPGHMKATKLEWEKQKNPYIQYWKEMME